jgi:hypothetical protein
MYLDFSGATRRSSSYPTSTPGYATDLEMADTFDDDAFEHFRFDEFLNFGADHRRAVLDALRDVCDEGRQRARSPAALEKLEWTLGLVLANALAAKKGAKGPCCFYSRGRSTYSARGAYNPRWLSYRTLIDGVIDPLRSSGLLSGLVSRSTGYGDAPRSTFEATDEICQVMADLGISADDVVRDDDSAPVLVLKGRQIGKLKPWLTYPRDHPEIVALDAPVRAYNAFIRDQDLQWGATEEVRAALVEKVDDKGRKRRLPDMQAIRLRRVFNDGQWNLGGRFFGGWWEEVPSDTRRLITINGEPTVELDFGGFLPRAIYHLEGLVLDGDAYDIAAIRERSDRQGLDWAGMIRPSIKKMFAVILNSRTPAGRQYVRGINLPKGLTKTKGYELIEDQHQQIAGWFYQGRGLQLMNRESTICQRILSAGIAEGVVVLPVHDSFLVPESRRDWLEKTMDQIYFDEFGFHPSIH